MKKWKRYKIIQLPNFFIFTIIKNWVSKKTAIIIKPDNIIDFKIYVDSYLKYELFTVNIKTNYFYIWEIKWKDK